MRLKRLELFGFKSFADRTVFDFGVNSFTGIVGPNGCGKSNVVDALRWVLGERRPTSMRGAEMSDVIFKGSTSRPAMSVAEVSMVLDNQGEELEQCGAEVSITRRVFKSGEGEYLIDGERVRLKDVRELLFDTGLGSRGYAVLEQGRIDAVLSANPADRRSIFEEAAGISRYRQRRAETESRLRRTEQDMARLDDVLGELRTRVRSLKIQAGKAERFVAARDAWSSERRRYFGHRLHTLGLSVAELAEKLERCEREQNEKRREREDLESELATREAERASLMSEFERLSGELARLGADSRALDERRSHLSTRVTNWEEAADEERQRAEQLAGQLAERRAAIESWTAELEAARGSLDLAKSGSQERARALSEVNTRYRALRRSQEEQNERVLGLLHEKTESANTVRHLEESMLPAAERQQRALERLARSEEALAVVRREENTSRTAVEGAAEAVAEDEAGACVTRELTRNLGRQLVELEGQARQAEVQRTQLEARVEALLDRERELADLGQGARRVLAAAEGQDQDGPCGEQDIKGLIADHLSTPTRYARALDAALGQRGQALVVADAAVAAGVIEWLKRELSGQVSLVTPRGLARRPDTPDIPESAELVGRLLDFVECSPGFEQLAELSVGDVFVVPDLDCGLRLVERFPRLRFVTPEGDLVDCAGLVGGYGEITSGAVGRRSSAAELQPELAALSERCAAFESRRTELESRRAEALDELARLETRLEERRSQLAEVQADLRTALARLADHESGREVLDLESRSMTAELEKLELDLNAARERCRASEAEFQRENESYSRLEGERAGLEEQRDEKAREEGRAEIDVTRLGEQLEALTRRIADLERVSNENQVELERAQRLAREHTESGRAGRSEREHLAEQSTTLLEERGQLESQLERVKERVALGQEGGDQARKQLELATRELERQGEQLGAERLVEQRLSMQREELLRRAEEELELSEANLREGFEPEPELLEQAALDTLEGRVRELRSELDRLGPVNLEAFDELAEVGERLDFLEAQYEDLTRARIQLGETLREIDAKSKALFVETFEQVRANFQRIFRQLFGGGRADVHLAEGEDVLEAGVEIVARPPGREMLSIALLSGGQRSLTALALLFAVFEARPSPFCVLDEVDAALDDANIERFLGMLGGFRDATQFVVVTHNKGTMSACQALFGVTMQTKGVSRYVSVELEEVDAFVPEVRGVATQADSDASSDTGSEAVVQPEAQPNGVQPLAQPASAEQREQTLDSESGEPVIELVPANLDADGRVRGGLARRGSGGRELAEGQAGGDPATIPSAAESTPDIVGDGA